MGWKFYTADGSVKGVGTTGATGGIGPMGPAVPGRDGEDGADSWVPGIPGLRGSADSVASAAAAYISTPQSIPDITYTAVTWDVEFYDTDVIHDTAVNNSRFTVPAGLGGKWLVWGTFQFTAGLAAGNIVLAIAKVNGSFKGSDSRVSVTDAVSNPSMVIAEVFDLAPGDYVEFFVYQNNGVAKTLISGATGVTAGITKITGMGPASTVPGPQGPAGQAVFGEDGDDSWVPGPRGPASLVPGPQGPVGQGRPGEDGDDGWPGVANTPAPVTFTISALYKTPVADDFIVWRAPFKCTVTALRVIQDAGTGSVGNAFTGSLASPTLISTAGGTTVGADTWVSATVNTPDIAAGASVYFRITSVSGSPTELGIQLELTRP